ncbi:MAG: cation:proton antiporter [Alicyclobacillus macrosporangiidus]|uniref:cation:proton antiporter n=1 Tax=Alicyclobacillus macrosporangiidus TaxID=392015 RepID=UPI0026EEBD09|nr:cation:proton antiporter [Alicyclobacillus macrosporangiidus]MCL6597732.1 cation:proton antiporter [Alicyclobacillus macrosporangiidus]
MNDVWMPAALWMGMALAAGMVSARTGVSVALVEIVVGVLAGNVLHVTVQPWMDVLAGFGSVLLTFLAGAEIDPVSLRRHGRVSVTIGAVSFLLPFAGGLLYTCFVAGWSFPAAKLAGIALSTTSVAVVYAVMVETGLNQTDLGKAILAACFVTDLGTVLALGILFSGFTLWMCGLLSAILVGMWGIPKGLQRILLRRAHRPEVVGKGLMAILFVFGALAMVAGSEPVLPAYLIGLALAGVLQRHPHTVVHLRTMTFTVLTPFYFLKAGLYVSLPAMWHHLGWILALFAVKMVTKALGVRPLASWFGYPAKTANYTTAMMATGLTFGTISSLYGLNHHIITEAQYTALVTVVILSALIPTFVAQVFFFPGKRASEITDKPAVPAVSPGTPDGGA